MCVFAQRELNESIIKETNQSKMLTEKCLKHHLDWNGQIIEQETLFG